MKDFKKNACIISVLENGSDMIVSILFEMLKLYIEDFGRLPRKLHLNVGTFKRRI